MQSDELNPPSLTTARLDFSLDCLKMAHYLLQETKCINYKVEADFNRLQIFIKEKIKLSHGKDA